jgi:hypothetical protein
MIAEKQVIPLEQGLTVICDVLKAHHKVDCSPSALTGQIDLIA